MGSDAGDGAPAEVPPPPDACSQYFVREQAKWSGQSSSAAQAAVQNLGEDSRSQVSRDMQSEADSHASPTAALACSAERRSSSKAFLIGITNGFSSRIVEHKTWYSGMVVLQYLVCSATIPGSARLVLALHYMYYFSGR